MLADLRAVLQMPALMMLVTISAEQFMAKSFNHMGPGILGIWPPIAIGHRVETSQLLSLLMKTSSTCPDSNINNPRLHHRRECPCTLQS